MGSDDKTLRTKLMEMDIESLLKMAQTICWEGHGSIQTWSPKVFIPLTNLCRNVCHYCTFAHPPRRGEKSYLIPDQILEIAEKGRRQGATEALFTLGDKPELRYGSARAELASLGYATTVEYLEAMCAMVVERTGLLPHVNAGVMNAKELARLRVASASQGLMLETSTLRLSAKGGPHHGSPDKEPDARLAMIAKAGALKIPFTSGILIGIGETREERIDALIALRALHRRYGHIQEIIIQNFRAKPGTRMAAASEPSLDELLWSIAAARIIFGPRMSIQAPPNLSPGVLKSLIAAGINDWGGVSSVTPDHVNPEAPWPAFEGLRKETESAGKTLVKRLTIYPHYARNPEQWQDRAMVTPILRLTDSEGFAKPDDWSVGASVPFPVPRQMPPAIGVNAHVSSPVREALSRIADDKGPIESDLITLFGARGREFDLICEAADRLRKKVCGDTVSYVTTRNINYTNVCEYACKFCAFSKGRGRTSLRGKPYDLSLDEVARRAVEAVARGGTEVCMQGGIHPSYTGDTYIELLETVRAAAPSLHIHAFSPLEITHGAETLNLPLPEYLARLKAAGLNSLPGTAAEILDDRVRTSLCPDKLTTQVWLDTVAAAHRAGLRSTATIMFGHLDAPVHWARHLLRIRELQAETGGFTEFVPLPFVHDEAPLYLQGKARRGPTSREVILMHAIARLALHPLIPNIQVSWVKLGADGAKACLDAGANDLGGTLMNESISAAAGAQHGQEMSANAMESLIRSAGRLPRQRTTLYGNITPDQHHKSMDAAPLSSVTLNPVRKRVARQHKLESAS